MKKVKKKEDNSIDNIIDVHIGQKLREIREGLGFSQFIIATEIGVTQQQIQKYETAESRIYSSTLFHIATFLNVDVRVFFDDLKQ